MTVLVDCDQCGVSFCPRQRGSRVQTHCSQECSRKARGHGTYSVVCGQCGVLFSAPNSQVDAKFCSATCHGVFNRARVATRCKNPDCGAVFEDTASKDRKYCSRACFARVSTHPDVPCDNCGGLFKRVGSAKYCSLPCAYAAHNTRVCANPDCTTVIAPNTPNVRYCSGSCKTSVQQDRLDKSIRREGSRRLYLVSCPDCDTTREITGMGAARQQVCRECTKLRRCAAYEWLSDREWLAVQYEEQSGGEIARALGCTAQTVSYWLAKHGIRVRTREEAQELRHRGEKKQVKLGRNRQMVTGGARQGVGFTTIPGVASDIYSLPHSEAT